MLTHNKGRHLERGPGPGCGQKKKNLGNFELNFLKNGLHAKKVQAFTPVLLNVSIQAGNQKTWEPFPSGFL